jgi:enoyl-[acyl-carrier protein] reductase II
MIHPEICDLPGIRHPILLAGMAGVSFGELTAAVSEADGMGILWAANLDADRLQKEIRKTRTHTRRPFGVDLLMAVPEMVQEQIELIFKENIQVFISGLAVPEGLIARARKEGIEVISMIGKVTQALRPDLRDDQRCAGSERDHEAGYSRSRRGHEEAEVKDE